MISEFEEIYAHNRWGNEETRSGPGSTSWATEEIRGAIEWLAGVLGPDRVLDAGCGEGIWMPDLPGYVGMDGAPQALVVARATHPDRAYLLGDIRTGFPVLPTADLVITRDAMQHLPLEDGLECLDTFRETGARWLLASSYRDEDNWDVWVGGTYRVNLQSEPFNLGEPVEWVPDGRMQGRPEDDVVKGMGLWPL